MKQAIIYRLLKVKYIFLRLFSPKFTLANSILNKRNLYLGSLMPSDKQFYDGNFVGLAHKPISAKDINCDLRQPLPFPDASIEKIQGEDVLEHLEFEDARILLDEIWRVLIPGKGVFRMSVPDYMSPLLRRRSVYNFEGEVIADLMTSTEVRYDHKNTEVKIIKTKDGNAHLWFPTFKNVHTLISKSSFKNAPRIQFSQYWIDYKEFNCQEIEDLQMPVSRSVPNDNRNNGAPVSIVVDLYR